MSFANLVLHGLAMAGAWVTVSSFGGMVGTFAATVLGRSAEECAEWSAIGNVVGCVLGLPVAVYVLVFVSSL